MKILLYLLTVILKSGSLVLSCFVMKVEIRGQFAKNLNFKNERATSVPFTERSGTRPRQSR